MNIVNSYIIEQPKLSSTATGTALVSAAEKQQKTQQAQDSYRKNAATAEVIDAEYVDYRPNSKPLTQERRDLNNTLEAGNISSQQQAETSVATNRATNKYQSAPTDLPIPGTYINTFA